MLLDFGPRPGAKAEVGCAKLRMAFRRTRRSTLLSGTFPILPRHPSGRPQETQGEWRVEKKNG